MGNTITDYLNNNPKDLLIFEEVFDRANMNDDEQIIFWKAIANLHSALVQGEIDEAVNRIHKRIFINSWE